MLDQRMGQAGWFLITNIPVQASVRAFAFYQITASVVPVVLAFTARVDALAELAAGIVAVVGFDQPADVVIGVLLFTTLRGGDGE